MRVISIIIPIYYGKDYISKLIEILERNQDRLDSETKLEVVFVNDSPDDGEIESYVVSEKIKTNVVEHKKNSGIHQSRVDGFNKSIGEYVCFLDQDDEISEVYFKSQLERMRKADVVVCNGKFLGEAIFENEDQFLERVSFEFFVNNGNYIISTGQSIINREKIPTVWINNILSHNGADDYFLWLAMMADKSRFAYNPSVLYFHRMVENNTSSNQNEMFISVKEMLAILLDYNYIDSNEKKTIETIHEISYCSDSKTNSKYERKRKEFNLLMRWKKNDIKGLYISNWLKGKGIKSVSIYGAGNLGRLLMLELLGNEIKVDAIIDKKEVRLYNGIPCVSLNQRNEAVEKSDVIIDTTLYDFYCVKKMMDEMYNVEVISLKIILYNLDDILE